MDQTMRRFIGVFVLGAFLLGACQSQPQQFLPITGSNNEATLPAQINSARQNVLEYVLASRLKSVPPHTDWELEEIRDENEYHFQSGDWQMVIWAAKSDEQNQRVAILNRIEGLSWTGYTAPDGRVIDTAYGR